ncbi:formate dehydrogenase subunit gamma [Psychromarinibacter sp. C21-152]|uniref:Formate dehydrogenase subunit gamma n=1 Tax=Psychromarinibacter sediminicola TaxID=3033385 RepID=A0AAE3NUT8_9RHOB|nr:formate dehydrogenase subunit gamma [Psychromarinibacter sediminicola]MDF0602691.1 formate dehydrogenase subunit gamma [Psychromarinibacter sediminicola]
MQTAPTPEEIEEIMAPHLDREGPLLPILHAVQANLGCVPESAVPVIAKRLNLTAAEVHGVVSFYHDFRKAPAGRHVVKICRAEACQSVGATALTERALERLGIGWGGTTPDGGVTVEPVYCLGLCACGPAAMVDGRVVGRLDEAKLDAILEEARA